MSERWISLNQLAEETGLAVRTLQYIRAQEPAVLVTRQRKATEYRQPDCAINLRKREAEKAVTEANPGDLDTARTRKANAEAELAEIDVAKARGEVVSVADYEAALARVLDRLTARLRAMPVRLAHLGTDAELAAETEAERIVVELSTFDEDVIDEPEPAKAAA